MIKIISPNRLKLSIWSTGPYMVYFNGSNPGINKDVVTTITEMSKNVDFVTILEIDWEKQLNFKQNYDPENMKKVKVYFKGEERISLTYPTFNQLDDFFKNVDNFI